MAMANHKTLIGIGAAFSETSLHKVPVIRRLLIDQLGQKKLALRVSASRALPVSGAAPTSTLCGNVMMSNPTLRMRQASREGHWALQRRTSYAIHLCSGA